MGKEIDLKKQFLDTYAEVKTSVKAAAESIGLSFQQIYAWRKADPDFANELELIETMVLDEILAAMKSAALECKDKTGLTAGIFLVKGKRPEYKENARQQVVVSGEVSLKDKCKQALKK